MTPTRTVEYDTKPLRNLCTDNLLGVELRPEDITEPMQSYYYAISCNKMEDYLKKLKLSDLMIGEM